MIDTVKFAIPLTLTEKEIKRINWTKISSETKDESGITTNFLIFKEFAVVGSPYISYTYKEHDHSISWLRVEVSLPKLRYGTNFYELDDSELTWTLNFLRLYLSKKLLIHPSKIPNIDQWKIKKLHLCKNFFVGQNMKVYLNAASKSILPQHKIQTFTAKGEDRLQSVIWKGKTRIEKLYNKFDEIKENRRRHYEYQIIEPLALGTLRYEIELSDDEIRLMSVGKTTTEILSSKTIIPKLNSSLNRLNLNQSLKNLRLKELVSLIEMDNKLKTNTKSSLIAFTTKYLEFGITECKATYSESGYKKVKAQFDRIMGNDMVMNIKKVLPKLKVVDFDFTKF